MTEKPKAKKTRSDAFPDKDIAKALRKFKGMQYLAADFLGMADSTLSDRIKASPYLQAVRESCTQRRLDVAELNLAEMTEEKDLGAICFLLKTKGKERGYGENPPVNTSGEHTRKLETLLEFLRLSQSSARQIDNSKDNASDKSL